MRTDTFILKGFYNMTDKTIIGQRIAELRKNLGLTQAELADKLGVSHQAISQWERSETLPDILTLPKIAEVFGESISYLLGIAETTQAGRKEETADKTDASPFVDENGTIVYDNGGVRVEISNTDAETHTIEIHAAENDGEEKTPVMEDNTVEIPIDGGDYSIVLEKNGVRVHEIPIDLQKFITIILKGNCEDVSCAFSLNVEGDVYGTVAIAGNGGVMTVNGSIRNDIVYNGIMTINSDIDGEITCAGNGGVMTIYGDIGNDIVCTGIMTITGDVDGDITCSDKSAGNGGNITVEGGVNGDVVASGSITIEGDLNGDADIGGSITVYGDLNGDASAGGSITVHGDMN